MNKKLSFIKICWLFHLSHWAEDQWKILSRQALMPYLDRGLGTSNVMRFCELFLRKFSLFSLVRCRKQVTGWCEVTFSGAAVERERLLKCILKHMLLPTPGFLSQGVGKQGSVFISNKFSGDIHAVGLDIRVWETLF